MLQAQTHLFKPIAQRAIRADPVVHRAQRTATSARFGGGVLVCPDADEKNMRSCSSTWVESVHVLETFSGRTVWNGAVQIFDLTGHPNAKRCYAWSHATEGSKRRFYAVLQLGRWFVMPELAPAPGRAADRGRPRGGVRDRVRRGV
jgi:hypothetical protein